MIITDRGAEVTRDLAAAPARVFGAFADATLVARWLKPAPEIRLEVLRYDFEVGGLYRFAYHVPGGPQMFVGGTFRTINPPVGLAFSWVIEPPDPHAGIPSEVTVEITPRNDGARLRISHDRLVMPDAIERHAAGWDGAVGLLAALLGERKSIG